MEKLGDDRKSFPRENHVEERKRWDFLKKRIFKAAGFISIGYHNRQRKKVTPSMTTSEENKHNRNTLLKNKIKLERRNAINPENFKPQDQFENLDDSDEDEDEWDSLFVSYVEYQAEELFCYVYHQCTNLVGQDINNEFGKNAIVAYLKQVFKFCDHKTEMLIRSLRKKQYPRLILKVDVLKTQNIHPKDIFSVGDLFYVIWISSDSTNRHFEKITRGNSKSIKDQLFKLPFLSSTEDVLHLELRDFIPPEDTNEEKSHKTTSNIKINEFSTEPIASAKIMLKDIPSTCQTKWIMLKRTTQGGILGKIQLKMTFGSEENHKMAFERHKYLVKLFYENVLVGKDKNSCDWNGTFCPEAELILRQHLIQSGLTRYHDLIAKCLGYLETIQIDLINFSIFGILLDEILRSNKELLLIKRKDFWNAVKRILKLGYEYIKNFRKITSNKKEALIQLHAILNILQNVTNCEIPPNLNLFPNNLYEWIETTGLKSPLSFQICLHEAVVQGACEWFEYIANKNNVENDTDEKKLNHMIRIAEMVILDLDDVIDLHEIFVKKVYALPKFTFKSLRMKQNFCYNKTVFFVYQMKVTELMETSIPKLCRKIKRFDITKCQQENIDCHQSFAIGSLLCTLFFKIQKFEKIGADLFSKDDTFETFPLRKFHLWFLSAVITWLDIAILKAMKRINEIVEMDDFDPIESTVQCSSSALDMLNTIYQIIKFWDQLEWPDVENRYSFLVKIIEDIFTASIHYADLIKEKINKIYDEKRSNFINNWCVAITNVDFILQKIQTFIIELRFDNLIHSLSDSKSLTAAERCKISLNQMMNHSIDNINQRITDLLETFSKKEEPSIDRFLQDGAELLHQQPEVIDYLKEHLNQNVISLNSKLNSKIFHRLSDALWEKISNILLILIENGIEKKRPTVYFSNLKETLHILTQFFKINGPVFEFEEENERLTDTLTKIERKLSILGMKTPELIHQYYLERLKEQEELDSPEDGELTVTLQINNGDKLIVEILNANNVIPMDSNGQSDPFIRVELIPQMKFSFYNYKTRVLKKTLYPIFKEKFSVTLTKAQLEVEDALIKFTIKDHDLCKNRYMAEAFIRLNDVGKNNPKLCNLKLNRPRNPENDILKSLEVRKNDKLARIFFKKEKAKIKFTQ